MKLILCLGNPGPKYKNTRHNLGFMVADRLAEKLGEKWHDSSKLKAEIIKSGDFIIAKPCTYMNNSGFAAQAIMKYYKIPYQGNDAELAGNLIVVHDDLDIDFGKCKVGINSRAAGHNGVQSVIDQLGTKHFTRYRLGIRTEFSIGEPAEKFVLENFSAKESKELDALIEATAIELLK